MTVELFITLLTISSIITSLVIEALKRYKLNVATNILALFVSVLIGMFTCFVAYVELRIPFSLLNCLYILAFVLANWLAAMNGYDKVMQTIKQIVEKGHFDGN